MDERGFHALIDDAGVVVVPRVVVRITGEQPLIFLHDTSTAEVGDLRAGSGALTCFLDEKGRVQAEARVLVLDLGSVLLDAEPAARGYLTGWLARIAPLSGCEIVEETVTVTALRGAKAETALEFSHPPVREHEHVQEHGLRAVRVEWGLPGFDVFGSSFTPAARAVDAATFEAARIAAGRPRFGVDVTDEMLVNETPLLLRAVSGTKGCYPGQESVARVQNLGRVRRRLAGLRSRDEFDFRAGSAVTWNGEESGAVTSGARIPGGTVAIARLRAEVADGETVEVAGRATTVTPL